MLRIIVLPLIACASALLAGCEPKARLTVRLVDDDGQPVVGAQVDVEFEHSLRPSQKTVRTGLTDAKGEFVAESRTSGFITYGADKPGYYTSIGDAYNATDTPGPAGEGYVGPQWLPMNTTQTLILRKIASPIPLAVKHVEIRTNSPRGQIAFDLLAGDWLPPTGRGTTPDLSFEWSGRWGGIDDREAQLVLRFSNRDDGLIEQPYSWSGGSALRMRHQAPLQGYTNGRSWRTVFKNPPVHPKRISIQDSRQDIAYFFRVRSQSDGLGKITNSVYGKIEGDIEFIGSTEEGIAWRFTYHLNPTPNDRNLEFDGKKNLFDPPGALSK